MRLGQLSRKLGVSTPEIIQFLASKQITIGEDSNAKIEDAHAHWVTEKFAPHLIASVEEVMAEEKQEVAIPVEATPVIETPSTEVTSEEPALSEVIKAPKIELAGLKVLGKIEIPEKKKKIDENTEGSPEEKERKPRSERPRAANRDFQERPRKNPVTLQREREQREAERLRKEKLAEEKEKKTNHYLNRVKPATPAKKMKRTEEAAEMIDTPVEKMPTTIWGKFMRWLNT
ncbi:MAG: hypothetical protein HOP30_18280 [Cyclobacteriaceae bacterium]|nr:hypothetical protein [Cyclobacteriaceae bacterium]